MRNWDRVVYNAQAYSLLLGAQPHTVKMSAFVPRCSKNSRHISGSNQSNAQSKRQRAASQLWPMPCVLTAAQHLFESCLVYERVVSTICALGHCHHCLDTPNEAEQRISVSSAAGRHCHANRSTTRDISSVTDLILGTHTESPRFASEFRLIIDLRGPIGWFRIGPTNHTHASANDVGFIETRLYCLWHIEKLIIPY